MFQKFDDLPLDNCQRSVGVLLAPPRLGGPRHLMSYQNQKFVALLPNTYSN
jgi:hypothetical protein